MKIVWRIVDLILGGIFVYAGVTKALDPVQFANDIDNYKMLPWFVTVRLAFYLPWLEIFCGLAVIFRFLYRGGLSILTALLAVFIGATVAAKLRGLDLEDVAGLRLDAGGAVARYRFGFPEALRNRDSRRPDGRPDPQHFPVADAVRMGSRRWGCAARARCGFRRSRVGADEPSP